MFVCISIRKEDLIKYVCVEGDKLSSLALKFQTTIVAIQILNRLPPSRQEFYPGEVILIIPQYLTSDNEALQSIVLNLNIEEKLNKYHQENETIGNIFNHQRISSSGNSNWGEDGIGFVNTKDIEFFTSKQGIKYSFFIDQIK